MYHLELIDGRDGSNIFFHYSSLKERLPIFNKCVNTFLEKLRPLADGKTEVPMKEAFHEVALDVISKVRWSFFCHLNFSTTKNIHALDKTSRTPSCAN